jgi:CHAT domain-containing protein/tetratricopeptide (TPR) repeat protein
MPIAWPRHRSALASFFIFPWFSALPSSPPEEQPPAVAAEAGVAGDTQTAAAAPEEPVVLPGVVIEEIPKGSELEKAGLQVGDVILRWERLPNPPANPEGAYGVVQSYFDWFELELEQVPRGAVVLRGRRGEDSIEHRVEPPRWEVKVRPVLSRALEEIYFEGQAQLASGNVEGAALAWRSIAAECGAEEAGDLRAWVALQIGAAWSEKDRRKAIEIYHQILESSERISARIAIWTALGQTYEKTNEFEAAERAYSSAFRNSQQLRPGDLGVAFTLANLGVVAFARNDFNGARDYLLQALRIEEKFSPDSPNMALSLGNLGGVEWTLGDFDRAQEYFTKALQINEKFASNRLGIAFSLNNLGVLAWSRGELEHAHSYHLQALQIREQLAPQSIDLAVSLTNLGEVAWSRGELEDAFDYSLRATRIYKKIAPGSAELAHCLNNLGSIAKKRGRPDLANDYYNQALQIRERLAPQSLGVSSTLTNLGTLAEERGELGRAYEYFHRSLELSEKIAPQSLISATTLGNLGVVARDRGDLGRASEFLLRGLAIEERLAPQSLTLANSLNQLGNVARARGELNLARDYHLRALEVLEHQVPRLGGSYSIQAGFRAQNGAYYRHLLDLLLTQRHFVEAFHILERFRAQTFLTMLAERDTAFTADIPEELDRERRRLGVLYDRTLKKRAGLNPRDHGEEIEATRRDLQKLDAEAGDIEARIRQASPRLAALKYPHPLDTAEVQQALDMGTLLLSYSVGKEKTALFALSRSGDLEVKILPLGEEALRSKVKQLLSLIREAAQGSSLGALRQRRVQAASRELYTALLGPVTERIAASERLLILPDGPLHALPFAALVRDVGADAEPGRGQYLAEWKPIHVALSATVFAELKQRRRPASESPALFQLAAFGDPVYPQSLAKSKGVAVAALPTGVGAVAQVDAPRGDPIVRSAAERGVFDWPPLPYTRREVEGIARLFPTGTARTFLGPDALEEKIKSLDPKTRILHLAAHSYTDEHLPSSSFVALTIPEDTNADASGPERDNGLLQVWEIFERVRLDADLVVLSACDTGLGEEQGGEGLIGLTRAFQYAGARTVMASLWSVQDQATSELMIRFYKHLRAGLTKDEALRQAQMELIRGPIEVVNEKGEKSLLDATAPYFWAGFQVYGDWQ